MIILDKHSAMSKRVGNFFKNQSMFVFWVVLSASFLIGCVPYLRYHLLPGYLFVKGYLCVKLTLMAIDLLSLKKCNLCHSTQSEFLFRKNSFDIVKCKKCDLVCAQPQPSDEEIRDLYSADFFEGRKQLGSYSAYFKERDCIVRNSKKFLRQFGRYKQRGKILDVGCAAGFFLDVARAKKWQTTGIELSEYMASYARDVLGLQVINGKFTECDLPRKHFDVITMWDFLDHTQDPMANLRKAWKLLNEEGLLVLSTGDIGHWYAKLRGVKWRYFSPPVHLYYFSKKTIGLALEKIGFEVLEFTSYRACKSLGSVLFTIIRGSKRSIWSDLDCLLRKLHFDRLRICISFGDVMVVYARLPAKKVKRLDA